MTFGYDRAGASAMTEKDEELDWKDPEQIRKTDWMFGYKKAAEATIKFASQEFEGVLAIVCINGGLITQVEGEEMQKIVNKTKQNASKFRIKCRIELRIMEYCDFLQEYDVPAQHGPPGGKRKGGKKKGGKKADIHSAGSAAGHRAPPAHSAFFSLRFGEEHGVQPMAEELQAALLPKGVEARIINMKAGGDIDTAVFSQIEYCGTFVVFGSERCVFAPARPRAPLPRSPSWRAGGQPLCFRWRSSALHCPRSFARADRPALDRYGEDTGNPASTFNESKFAQTNGKRIILIRMIPFGQKFEQLQASHPWETGAGGGGGPPPPPGAPALGGSPPAGPPKTRGARAGGGGGGGGDSLLLPLPLLVVVRLPPPPPPPPPAPGPLLRFLLTTLLCVKQARQMFGLNKLEIPWMVGEPMPSTLPDQIIEGMGITPAPAPAPAPVGTPRAPPESADAAPATLSALAVSAGTNPFHHSRQALIARTRLGKAVHERLVWVCRDDDGSAAEIHRRGVGRAHAGAGTHSNGNFSASYVEDIVSLELTRCMSWCRA
eukprot:COSAG04_NODE_1565_length_6321_cov_5.077306_9_plen_546_part_00